MKILFLGNSYTSFNNMPKMLEALIRENGTEVEVHSLTKGGRKLCQNIQDENGGSHIELAQLLQTNVYDILFLQEQSYLPLVDKTSFEFAAVQLAGEVNARRTILYATWGRAEGAELLREHNLTSIGMTKALYRAYKEVARLAGAEVSAVGLCFAKILERDANAPLYAPDLSHPSYMGSAAAAICHYKRIFGKLPERYSSIELDEYYLSLIRDSICELP